VALFGCDVMCGTVVEFRLSEEDCSCRDNEVQGSGINSESPEFSHRPTTSDRPSYVVAWHVQQHAEQEQTSSVQNGI
jgi:hypothetical protein